MGSGHYQSWDSPQGQTIEQLYYTVKSSISKPGDCDVMILMSGVNDGSGYAGLCDPFPGTTFVMKTRVTYPANTFQHEASHFFNAPDHGWDLFTYCCMSYYYTQSTRVWCSGCTSTINSNRFHYD